MKAAQRQKVAGIVKLVLVVTHTDSKKSSPKYAGSQKG